MKEKKEFADLPNARLGGMVPSEVFSSEELEKAIQNGFFNPDPEEEMPNPIRR
jgi:hypothetical protein